MGVNFLDVGSKVKESAKGHECCICIVGFSICRCRKKSIGHKSVAGPELFIALKQIQATLYLIPSGVGSQYSVSRKDVEWRWRGTKRTSLAANFGIFWRGG